MIANEKPRTSSESTTAASKSLQGAVDSQRYGLRDGQKLPAKMMDPPNSPRARAQAVTVPATNAGKAKGSVFLVTPLRGPRRRPSPPPLRRGLDWQADGGLTHVEVHGEVERGHHDRRRGEAELYPQNPQVLAEEPHPPEGEQRRYHRGAGGNAAERSTRVLTNRFPESSARARTNSAGVPTTRMIAMFAAVVLALKSTASKATGDPSFARSIRLPSSSPDSTTAGR
jgi:hypothetical protein